MAAKARVASIGIATATSSTTARFTIARRTTGWARTAMRSAHGRPEAFSREPAAIRIRPVPHVNKPSRSAARRGMPLADGRRGTIQNLLVHRSGGLPAVVASVTRRGIIGHAGAASQLCGVRGAWRWLIALDLDLHGMTVDRGSDVEYLSDELHGVVIPSDLTPGAAPVWLGIGWARNVPRGRPRQASTCSPCGGRVLMTSRDACLRRISVPVPPFGR